MKNKIEQLKVIQENIEVMISILSGQWNQKDLYGDGTIREQIECYDFEGRDFTDLYNSIIKEHGDEQCPFGNDRELI